MLRIFLTNLGKYNEGFLVGEWVELPCDDFSPVFERIGINDFYEEYFITDYESDVYGLKVGEYDDLEDLNELARVIEEDPEKVEVLMYYGYEDADKIRDNLDNIIYVTTPTGFESDEYAVGYYFAEECGFLSNVPEEVKQYFDYEAYGYGIYHSGSFYTCKNGDIFELVA